MKPQGLTGLTGMAGLQVQINTDSQATPEERYGGTADPRHAYVGEVAVPYPWQSQQTQAGVGHGPYGPENQLLSDEWWFIEPAGDESQDVTFDRTPSTGAAPWPKGILSGPIGDAGPSDTAGKLVQSAAIHATDMGASRRIISPPQAVGIQQDSWNEIWQVDPNSSDQVNVPKQMMSSGFMWGTRDRVQSMARQNEFGFDSRHMHRRYADGPIPGNTMWMRPGGRPLAKSLPGPARPAIGADSPFQGDNLGASFNTAGAILANQPTQYQAPSQPYLAPAIQYTGDDAQLDWY